MFPRAIQQASKPKQVAYSLFLPIALFIWILPLLAVFLTSVRGAKDINTGNVFGWPSEFKFVENYTAVFMQTEAVKYFFNSFLITLPAVAISIASGLFGWLCVGYLSISSGIAAIFPFCGRKLCAVSDFNGSCARHVGANGAL